MTLVVEDKLSFADDFACELFCNQLVFVFFCHNFVRSQVTVPADLVQTVLYFFQIVGAFGLYQLQFTDAHEWNHELEVGVCSDLFVFQ